MSARPYYMRYPSDFIGGIAGLSSDQICVYAVLLDLLYARRRKLEAGAPKDRQGLARTCSMTTRKFNIVLEELIAIPNKLTRDSAGRLSNPKFDIWLERYGEKPSPDLSTEEQNGSEDLENISEKNADNRGDNRGDKSSHIEQDQPLKAQTPPPSLARARTTQNQYKKNTTYIGSRGVAARTTMPASEKLARFQQSLASSLGPHGWWIVCAAADPNDPHHAKSLALCKAQATKLGKGWPSKWPCGG